ncbi:MAG TPA: M28 family peptidase [Blastocatellia bacterium]|nr:M28 family peptidase [Blastocatellia bacterium]
MFSNRFKCTLVCAGVLLIGLVFCGGCQEQASGSGASPDPAPSAADKPIGVDANRAYEDVKKMVEMGPRPSGSAALKKTQQFIETELSSYGLTPTEDRFDGDTPHGKIPMMNIIARVPGSKPDIVLITGHYDTAPLPAFVGANDGGSSAASVLEIARVLAKTKPEYTLWFVFFDGEEAVVDWDANNRLDNTYGSRHLLAKLAADGTVKQVRAMILVDMIGDKALDIRKDANSTPWLVDIIWDTAQKYGAGGHFLGNLIDMDDDHTPFRHAGIPVVDVIDFNYGPDNDYWHTAQDTLDKISGESIKTVSDVVIGALGEVYAHLNSGP